MTKEDLLRRLEELGFDRKEYWVVSGGAMVLYGLRKKPMIWIWAAPRRWLTGWKIGDIP